MKRGKKMEQNKKCPKCGAELIMEEETADEIVVRFSNIGRQQKLNDKKRIGLGREHCVGDYSCCGHIP